MPLRVITFSMPPAACPYSALNGVGQHLELLNQSCGKSFDWRP